MEATEAVETPIPVTLDAPVDSNQEETQPDSLKIELANAKLIEGKRHLICGDLATSSDCFQEALEIFVSLYGELAPECADAYYNYGCSLLNIVRAESEILTEAPTEQEEGDEEEEEEEEAEITSERIEKVGEELSFHKEELERLKSKDPEFYKFLAENDRKLLDFDDEEEEDDEEDDEEEDENAADETDEDEEQKEISSNEEKEVPAHLMEEGSSKSRIQLTMKHLTHWETSLKQKITIPILREVLHGFKAAAHIHDEELDGKKGENFDGKVTGNLKYAITSPTIFSAVLNISMNFVPAAFDELVKFDSSNSHKSLPNMNSSLWKKHKTMIKSFFGNLLHLFLQTNESAMACFLIKHMENNMAYICSFPKMLKLVMKTLLQHWATDAEEKNRVVSFLAIRKMILTAPYPFIDICLKSSYLSFVRNCKFTSTH
eukprot:Sdes_comp14930_c0_seq1m3626